VTPVTAHLSPLKYSGRAGFNDKAADLIAKFVGSMWMLYASIIGFAIWMAHDGGDDQGSHPTSRGSGGREDQRAVRAPTA
jgi:hypothetical protein